MMKPLDPYTRFLSGSSKDRLDMLRTGKYGGVGIQIGLRRDTLTVLTPFEDSPAYSEGIHSGDQILMIDSVKTKGMSLKDASKLIKGELGSHLDRHDHIGLGQIGNSGLSKVIKLMNKNKIPIILETPIDDRRDEFEDIGTAKELA